MITLCMIVKDEEKTIEDTLRHALPAVDAACIVDTGSQDKTIELTDRMIRGLHGGSCFVSKTWKDFSTNRNECLALAEARFGPPRGPRDGAAWLLMLDADSRLFGAGLLRKYLARAEASEHSAYYIRTICGEDEYGMCRVFRAGSGWRYEGRVHELPTHSREQPGPMIPGVWIEYQGTDRGSKEATWLQHVDLLHQDLNQGIYFEVPQDRARFYLAQTYECLGAYNLAGYHYRLRYESHTGSQGEKWEAGLRLASILHRQGKKNEAGQLASELRLDNTSRAEPLYLRALWAAQEGLWEIARCEAKEAAAMPVPSDPTFVRRDVYRYKARLLLARACLETGRIGQAKALYSELKALTLPDVDRLLVAQHLAMLDR